MATGMVVCAEPIAAEVGAEFMRRGGNAVEAAVAAAFVQGVTNPAMCGIGGKGVMTVYSAPRGEMTNLRFWGQAGSRAQPDIFANDFLGQEGAVTNYKVKGDRNMVGYESIMLPGFVQGMWEAWRRWGRRPSGRRFAWGDLLEPAIRLARDGFQVYPYLDRFWGPEGIYGGARVRGMIAATPAAEAIYLRDGQPYGVGERLVQRDYARTLERIAVGGADVFYHGEIAHAMTADLQAHGGLFTQDDLQSYQVLVGEPVIGSYRGYQVLSDRPPGCGALLVELLNIVEGWDLKSWGWNTPEYLDKIARAMQLVFADRAKHMADPQFVGVPLEHLVSREHAADLRHRIDTGEDLREPSWSPVGASGTTHLSVLDPEGNAVSLTHTLGYASGVVTPGLGFLYNNDMMAFDPVPGHRNSIAPGKTPVNGGAPTILLKDGQAAMVIGSPAGARKLTAMLQAIINVIDFGMDMQEAVSVQRIHSEDRKRLVLVEPSFPEELAQRLEALGNTVRRERYTARLSAIWRNPETGEIQGGADPRGGGGLARVD